MSSEMQLLSSTNHTLTDFQNIDLLLNKLEKLANGVNATLSNITLDRQEVAISLGGPQTDIFDDGQPQYSSHAGVPRITNPHGLDEMEYSRVVSDIWIGVILTLLIVSVIFFICACFLYHKFQQWKNSYHTNNTEPLEMCRNCPTTFEAESLPSYTIVSGLPTYDDALDEFRKAGILLTSNIPIIQIFEAKDNKDSSNCNIEMNDMTGVGGGGGVGDAGGAGDNVSIASMATCTCGGNINNANSSSNNTLNQAAGTLLSASYANLNAANAAAAGTKFIELSPEQLAQLSQKRLSLQIAFPMQQVQQQPRRNSRVRVDMRNNLLRSRVVGNSACYDNGFAPIHRSTSTFSLANERMSPNGVNGNRMQHRGSLF